MAKKVFEELDRDNPQITSKNIDSEVKTKKEDDGFMAYVQIKDGNATKNIVLYEGLETKEEAIEEGEAILMQLFDEQKQPQQQPAMYQDPMAIDPQQVM